MVDDTVSWQVEDCLDSSAFAERLAESVATWRKDLRRGVWLKIPVAQAGFMQVCRTTTTADGK